MNKITPFCSLLEEEASCVTRHHTLGHRSYTQHVSGESFSSAVAPRISVTRGRWESASWDGRQHPGNGVLAEPCGLLVPELVPAPWPRHQDAVFHERIAPSQHLSPSHVSISPTPTATRLAGPCSAERHVSLQSTCAYTQSTQLAKLNFLEISQRPL